jgi:hypothetical protein
MAQDPTQERWIAMAKRIWKLLDSWVERSRWLLLTVIFAMMLTIIVLLLVQNRVVVETTRMIVSTEVVVTLVPPATTSLKRTPTQTSAHTPVFTPNATTLPPTVSGIVPAATVQGSGHPFPITIIGENFMSGVTACLGPNIPITVASNTTKTITGALSPNISPGIYDLTVKNPDGQSGTLSPIFIMQEPESQLRFPVLVIFDSDAQ